MMDPLSVVGIAAAWSCISGLVVAVLGAWSYVRHRVCQVIESRLGSGVICRLFLKSRETEFSTFW
ncbi:hypothetical protein F5X97DRAFT_324269 [Nemania serpens]|nr:hypothetical protein F5X97DRAFT_324269 [Nemania serpens]